MPTGSASGATTGKDVPGRPPSGRVSTAAPSKPTSAVSFRSTLNAHGYILGKTLGTGTYGKVKFAHSLRLNHPVAIKIVSRKVTKDVHLKFLPRELEAMRALKHKNVIELIEVVETRDHVYIVMEMAEGGDLLDYINKKRYLSEDEARLLFHDLVDGLAECHRMKFVHRDLKCENMLLDRNLRLKITDFGFARKFSELQKLQTYCGSYAYAAPEIIIGEPYLGRTADVWSIGVILYAMVCGKLPFKDKDAKALLSDVASKIHFPSRLDDKCKDLIQGILKFVPKERLTLEEIKHHPWMLATSGKRVQPVIAKPLSEVPPPLPPRTHKKPPPPPAHVHPPPESHHTRDGSPPPLPPRANKTAGEKEGNCSRPQLRQEDTTHD